MAEDLKFTLSTHASVVVAERGIPQEWIERVLSNPMKTEDDAEDPELRHALSRIPEHGDRVLRVVYNKTVEPWRIVTVYFVRTQRGKL